MKLLVKVLNGQECTINMFLALCIKIKYEHDTPIGSIVMHAHFTTVQAEISPNSGVNDVKEQLQALLTIPVVDQKLLFKGKSLLDEKLLSDYSVEDGCKLTLVVKKVSSVSSKTDAMKKSESVPVVSKMEEEERPVWVKMRTFLKRHYREKDAEAVLAEFKKEFQQNLSSLSLDDIERLAISKLRQA